ncbi:MIF4G domain-containing protein B-like isoform X1 [Dermacentor albipictus]|uniref:MIF4G domain-containing protein B-like isoform X1 n=2 Tax=Dermacentor albipictus TaxID=60249 RepID=UPI0031FBE5C4
MRRLKHFVASGIPRRSVGCPHLHAVVQTSTQISMERRKQSKTQGSQDDSPNGSQDQENAGAGGASLQQIFGAVPSTSSCLSTPAEAVEPPAHGEGSHVPDAVSQVFAPSAADCHNVFRRAMQEPSSLSTDDLKLLAVAICQSAIRRVNYAIPAAEFCLAIIERGERAQAEGCETFLESLLLFCRELFNSRDEVLRPPDQPTVRSRRWVAYVTFLAELLDGLSAGLFENTLRPCRGGTASTAKARSMMVLATLLCVSCHTILQPPSLYNPTEMDCLRTALTTAGAALERVAPERLAALLREIHATLEMQGLPIRSRHVLLELKELQAAGWQLSPPQQPGLSSGTGR